jgi:hypothetical protein
MTDEVASTPVACAVCGARVPIRYLDEHKAECRRREHTTQERSE